MKVITAITLLAASASAISSGAPDEKVPQPSIVLCYHGYHWCLRWPYAYTCSPDGALLHHIFIPVCHEHCRCEMRDSLVMPMMEKAEL